ncbi:hypothetical protein OpiT1DRAFT_03542, partial [Opitutaceae bacterium TAV1]
MEDYQIWAGKPVLLGRGTFFFPAHLTENTATVRFRKPDPNRHNRLPHFRRSLVNPVSFSCTIILLLSACVYPLAAAEPPAPAAPAEPPQYIDIFEYRVEGVHKLTPREVEKTVYPWLGEARTPDDVEGARLALEKTVPGQGIPDGGRAGAAAGGAEQYGDHPGDGREVGRLRIRGSRYFDHNRIREKAPSIAEGEVPDFNAVTRD